MSAVAGFAALALLANPAIGSAVVTGTAAVTAADNVITVSLSGVGSPTLTGCAVQVADASGNGVAGGFVLLFGSPGHGDYVSQRLTNGTYAVFVSCLDGDGPTSLTPAGGVPVTLDADREPPSTSIGSVKFEGGSVPLDGGSVGKIFGS
ncbi:hypothetical protein [Rhodococcus sp. NPDC059234]|uniref:hypothetical protein n=1 Tax=Rhodococcus sp. NPDC059234 TaxID=3346781 RepID=UPI00366EDB85